MTAGACPGTFGADDREGSWFVGITHHEGMETDTIVGWGRRLCSNSAVEWDSDYSIRVEVDGVIYETGQKLTCGKKNGKEMNRILKE